MQYHLQPPKGWMNDPNGLVYFRGRYHAFYQHYPHAAKWGPMHWGHAVSDDLLRWEHLPIALTPDEDYENDGGCWSGSAVVRDDRLWLFYTAVGKAFGQAQCAAVSDDGVTFTKLPQNPIIRRAPEGQKDFRDPKITEVDGVYHMVVGSGQGNAGQLLHYTSQDLLAWEYCGVLLQGKRYGKVMECPDMFPLGDEFVLMWSHMHRRWRATEFAVGRRVAADSSRSSSQDNFAFDSRVKVQRPIFGPHFYAAQSFADASGQRILMGWLWSWRKRVPKHATRAGALSTPLLVRLERGKVRLRPVHAKRGIVRDGRAVEVFWRGRVLFCWHR
ncbi:MAG: glycoside hydrolase family 32 protein [Oscillospiraceae bacterium]|nr:glycoside hydrolase family 32 protein [Oscillospiraceae bacterium]